MRTICFESVLLETMRPHRLLRFGVSVVVLACTGSVLAAPARPENHGNSGPPLAQPPAPSAGPPQLQIPVLPLATDGPLDQIKAVCDAVSALATPPTDIGHALIQHGAPPIALSPGELPSAALDHLADAAITLGQGQATKASAATTTLAAPFAQIIHDAAVPGAACKALQAKSLNDNDILFLHHLKSLSDSRASSLVRAASALSSLQGYTDGEISSAFSGAAGSIREAAEPTTSFLGSLPQTVINGLADFVVTRAKQEAAQYIKDQLDETLCKNPNLRPYVSSLCLALDELDPSLTLNAAAAYLQRAALSDLQRLPEVALELEPTKTDSQAGVLLGLVLLRTIRSGHPPLDVIWSAKQLVCGKNAEQFSAPVASAACTASQIVYAVYEQGSSWQNAARAVSGSSSRYLALSVILSLEEERHTSFSTAAYNGAFPFLEKLNSTLATLDTLQGSVLKNADKAGTKDQLDLALKVIALAVDGARLTNCFATSLPAGASCLSTDSVLSSVASIATFASASLGESGPSLAISALQLAEQNALPLPPKLRAFVPFLTELSNAKSSADVEAAIAAAAAPVGSYATKYQRSAVTVTAFVGGSFGREWVQFQSKWTGSNVGGVFAPVGLHATTPLCPHFNLGVLLSVIDLGSLASSRLQAESSTNATTGTTSTVSTNSTIGLAQIFSPGLYLTAGLGGGPITLGVGGVITPGLRQEVTTDVSGVVTSSTNLASFRVQAFLAFDLTLLPL